MRQQVYLGLDAHVRRCVLACMDRRGKLLFSERLPTSEAALISHIVAIKAHKELLALEESSLAPQCIPETRRISWRLIIWLVRRPSYREPRDATASPVDDKA